MISEELVLKMTAFDGGCPELIQHLIKVYEFAHVIGEKEGIDGETLRVLDMAAILHDIGIRPAEEKYGRCDGKLQEEEGPAYARALLADFPEVTSEETERICYLIAHHHTYENVEGMDYRILLEADFLVNALENGLGKDAIRTTRDRIFETETGRYLLNTMFDL